MSAAGRQRLRADRQSGLCQLSSEQELILASCLSLRRNSLYKQDDTDVLHTSFCHSQVNLSKLVSANCMHVASDSDRLMANGIGDINLTLQ